MTLSKLRILWPSVTAFAMAGLVVARSFGHLQNFTDEQAQNLFMFLGAALTGLAVKSGYDDVTNASTIATVTAVAQTQAAALQEAGQAVVTAAVSQPTAQVIQAAASTAQMVETVAAEAQALIEKVK